MGKCDWHIGSEERRKINSREIIYIKKNAISILRRETEGRKKGRDEEGDEGGGRGGWKK